MKTCLSLAAVLAVAVSAFGDVAVENSASCKKEGSEYVVYRGEARLPGEGQWEIVTSADNILQAYLIPPRKEGAPVEGRRMQGVIENRLNRVGQYHVQQLLWPCREYAKTHEGVGPAAVTDLDPKRFKHIIDSISQSPWRYVKEEMGDIGDVDGPFVLLVPKVKFEFDKTNPDLVSRQNRQVLAFEFRPYLADGKHWVLYTDGSCERVDIDQDLVKKHDVAIRPVAGKAAAPAGPADAKAFKILVVCGQASAGKLSLVLENKLTNERQKADWDPSKGGADDRTVLDDLKTARQIVWSAYARETSSPVMQVWMTSYGGAEQPDEPAARGRRGEQTSVFGVLGGRAALRETLQMQGLDRSRRTPAEETTPVGNLKGVTVKSHPYEQMLKGGKGGGLPLADLVPADRFFVYMSRPSAILPLLEEGADFISRSGGVMNRTPIEYDLKTRYLGRLGLDDKWLDRFVRSGAITECALVLPDLFLIDGTEVTVISRVARGELLGPLLKLLGIAGLGKDGITEHNASEGRKSFWAMRGDLLFIGTNRSELEKVLALQASGGKESLGQSAEFRYMLTQLPVKPETRMYGYFSDSFIRALVGPAAKVGQMRRIGARADMECLTACGLLARLDGVKAGSVDALIKAGYAPGRFAGGDYEIDGEGAARSKIYGSLGQMKTLTEVPVEKVAEWEARAYQSYVEDYSRFWRQFFDPIAMRVDDLPDGSLEMNTFILPLIDNTIYNGIKEFVMNRESGAAMKAPVISPKPILMLSVNLRDEAWRHIAEGLSEMLTRFASVSPAILDDLGPALHLAIQDSDPVLALGAGDVFGVFGMDMMSMGRGGEMMFIPMALAVLTRPCTLAAETRNPARTLQYLRQAAGKTPAMPGGGRREVGVEFYQVEGKDSWVLTLDLFSMAKLRYGIGVSGNYLVIRNIPWSSKDEIASAEPLALNGARLAIFPAACNLQLPGLFASATDYRRDAAMEGMGYLYPLLAGGAARMNDVAEKHARLFGFKPVHPSGGQWLWENCQVLSSQYGTVNRQKQPLYKEGDREFGLLKDIQSIEVGMQFEDTGLRTQIRWKTAAPAVKK